jgi:hypothetical protein
MDIGALTRIVLMRWYVVLLGLLLTAVLGIVTVNAVQPQYTTTASVLVYRPMSVLGADGNPFVALGGLEAARDVVLKSINDPSVIAQLSDGDRQEILVVADNETSAPVITVTVTAATPDIALVTQTRVLDLIPATLEKLQTDLDVGKSAQVTSVVLAQSAVPDIGRKGQLRALVAVVGLGIALTIWGAVLFDRWRRRVRHQALDTEVAQTASADPPDPDSPVSPNQEDILFERWRRRMRSRTHKAEVAQTPSAEPLDTPKSQDQPVQPVR